LPGVEAGFHEVLAETCEIGIGKSFDMGGRSLCHLALLLPEVHIPEHPLNIGRKKTV
jgi:hypothetical protein